MIEAIIYVFIPLAALSLLWDLIDMPFVIGSILKAIPAAVIGISGWVVTHGPLDKRPAPSR